MSENIETVIVGGGHAGLVGERWRSERWDFFCFQFPNWTIEFFLGGTACAANR